MTMSAIALSGIAVAQNSDADAYLKKSELNLSGQQYFVTKGSFNAWGNTTNKNVEKIVTKVKNTNATALEALTLAQYAADRVNGSISAPAPAAQPVEQPSNSNSTEKTKIKLGKASLTGDSLTDMIKASEGMDFEADELSVIKEQGEASTNKDSSSAKMGINNAAGVSNQDSQGIVIAPGPSQGNPVYSGQPEVSMYKVCYDPRRPGYSYLVNQVTGEIVDRQFSMNLR